MTRAGGRFLKDPFKGEIPTGLVNSSNTVFVLSVKPSELDAVRVYLDGIIQIRGVHYTLGGVDNKTITMTDAPIYGQDIFVDFVEEN